MLIEMTSPVFKEKGKERDPIQFREGLNVVLGMKDGKNSIGKSSVLLAIDFVFGGNTYLKSDGVDHVGHHTIYFTFRFGDCEYSFARNTNTADKVTVCNRDYSPTDEVWPRKVFVDWLKEKYEMDFVGLSFRETLSSFFRVYGKKNADELNPLKGIPNKGMEYALDILVKLFNKYQDVEPFKENLDEQEDKLKTFRSARKYNFISDIVGGKTQFQENELRIKDLEQQLATLTIQETDSYSEEEIEKNRVRNQLLNDKYTLEGKAQAKSRKLRLIDLSIEYGLYPTEADLSALQEYFPEVNLRKLYEVEKFHEKLAQILDEQFQAERESVKQELESINDQIKEIQDHINTLGFVGNISKEFVDRHSEIKGEINALKTQNEAYVTLCDLQDAKKLADEKLKESMEEILSFLEATINAKMKELNDSLYTEPHKAPKLTINDFNSYSFETPDDNGTGSNYKGLVVYDLAILLLTALPALSHDSFILKNIEDDAIDGIMRIYEKSDKQIFIAFDKQSAYSEETQRILSKHQILKLSNNGSEFYGRSWNKEVFDDEDEL